MKLRDLKVLSKAMSLKSSRAHRGTPLLKDVPSALPLSVIGKSYGEWIFGLTYESFV